MPILSNFPSGSNYVETDPTVPAWAKASSKPSYTAAEVGATPASHASDSGVHVTSTEKTEWSSKAEAPKKVTISFSTSWTASGSNYTQPVTVSGGTANSLVALQPTAAQIVALQEAGVVAMMVDNNNGTFTATAIGAKPSAAMNIQATITEVE